MSFYDFMMATIKDFALVIGVIVALASLAIHWKSIFRPNLKRIEERRFKAVEEVYSLITDNRFVLIYATEKALSAEEYASLLNEERCGIFSPFLPEQIEKSLSDFLYKLTMLFLLPRVQESQNLKAAIKSKKEELRKAHEIVYIETRKWLGRSGRSLPFPVKPIGLGQQDVGE